MLLKENNLIIGEGGNLLDERTKPYDGTKGIVYTNGSHITIRLL